jgi:hypothetical protein
MMINDSSSEKSLSDPFIITSQENILVGHVLQSIVHKMWGLLSRD